MDNNQKILIGAIIVVLILLVGAYAVSQNNSGNATPTPTPVPGPTATPTATPTPAPVPTVMPTLVPTPTPAPTDEWKPPAEWPYYEFHWSNPEGFDYVRFSPVWGYLNGMPGNIVEYYTFPGIDSPYDDITPGYAQLIDGKVHINARIIRDGSLTRSYDVPLNVSIFSSKDVQEEMDESDVRVLTPVRFEEGQSCINVTIEYDADYLFTNIEGGPSLPYFGFVGLEIQNSPDYQVNPDTRGFVVFHNLY